MNSVTGLLLFALGENFLLERIDFFMFLEAILKAGIPLAISNYLFNFGLCISTNVGLTIMLNQFAVIVGYGYSLIKYNE
jgi:hypothetical protein